MENLDLDRAGNYLLALSGGPDSMALFQILLCGRYQFEVAHVDHGWRKESGEEALKLQALCRERGVVFHGHRLGSLEGNAEEAAREKRLQFFQTVYEKGLFTALLMAHHADDQVETILKRVFEGSTEISGIKRETTLYGMQVVRPLLSVFKVELLKYLEQRGVPFFEDPTNKDPKFLRSRMREEIVPYLEERFGKKIKENILLLGKRMKEEPSLDGVVVGPLGYSIEKTLLGELLLRHLLKKEGLVLPRGEVDKILALDIGGWVEREGWQFFSERDTLFMVKEMWNLVVEKKEGKIGNWKDLWLGSSGVFCPKGELGPPDLSAKLPNGVKLREWYRMHKVPKWLRTRVPVFWLEGKIVRECLTGKSFSGGNSLCANHLLTLKREPARMDPCIF